MGLDFEGFEVWGLTGGIAAGKSAAARFFAEEGIPVIDADRIARELSQPGGAAHAAVVKRFGTADRAKLREIVFQDPESRRDLESILHPMIQAESYRRMAEAAASFPSGVGKPRMIYEAALLVETGRYKQLSGLLVVDAPASVRRERLVRRDGVAPELADRIIAVQVSDEERRSAATHILPNHGTLDDLRQAVRAWIAQKKW